MNTTNDIEYHHFRNLGRGKHKTHVTVAIMVTTDMVYLGYAQCGKKDQFSKKLGRAIAKGRLLKAKEGSPMNKNFTQRIDRIEFGLTGPKIKREVVAIAKSSYKHVFGIISDPEKNCGRAASSYPFPKVLPRGKLTLDPHYD